MKHSDGLSAYEERALRDLAAWKSPKHTLLGRVGDRAERIIKAVTDLVPLRLAERVLEWVMPRMSDVTWRATSETLTLRA